MEPQDNAPSLNDLLKPDAVALLLGVQKSTLAQWRTHKKGPKFYKLGYNVRYRRSDIDAYIKLGGPVEVVNHDYTRYDHRKNVQSKPEVKRRVAVEKAPVVRLPVGYSNKRQKGLAPGTHPHTHLYPPMSPT